MKTSRLALVLSTAALLATVSGGPALARPHVRRVCNGSTVPCPPGGHHKTIAHALRRARPGDWILVWPGVYHEKQTDRQGNLLPDGLLITTPSIHLRGLDRNLVIVDGSNGTADDPCPSDLALQDLTGRNGIEISKVDGVSVENLTVCNYLPGPAGGEGNQIWWNGGDGSGLIGMGSYTGSYLTATSTFYDPNSPLAEYGIFVSNARGPGTISYSYASNMADSDFYVGACPDCNATLSHVRAQNSSLGYSGTNAGGHLIIEDSEWDCNKVGILPNSLNNDDKPPPQNGLCPDGSGASCTFIQHNNVHDNNNPNVPCSGITCQAPIGTGIEISGGQHDTIQDNCVWNQCSWGIVTHDFPDTDMTADCNGGVNSGGVCLFTAMGNVTRGNTLQNNGGFGNPTNSDLANQSSSNPRNCFYGNMDPDGLTSEPPMIETVDGQPCDAPGAGSATLAAELVCAANFTGTDPPPCPPGSSYPQTTQIQMFPLPSEQPMPDPCAGLPRTRWCPYAGPHSTPAPAPTCPAPAAPCVAAPAPPCAAT